MDVVNNVGVGQHEDICMKFIPAVTHFELINDSVNKKLIQINSLNAQLLFSSFHVIVYDV